MTNPKKVWSKISRLTPRVDNDLTVKAAGDDLVERYQKMFDDNYWDSAGLVNKKKRLQQMVEIGIDLIQSHSLTHEEDQAILQFLINQIYANQP